MSDTDLTGKLLIAMPSIGDTRFSKAVILVCANTPEYSMGLVLNQPMPTLTLPQLLDQLGIAQDIKLPDTPVLNGGPVGTDRGFVVHSDDVHVEGATMEVGSAFCLTATREILVSIASDSAPREAIMALGYAGWGAGQLEAELAQNAWIVGTPDQHLVYGDAHDEKWTQAIEKMGIDSTRLHGQGGRA